MGTGQSFWGWWRRFLGAAPDRRQIALEVLSERYIDESQQLARFTEHAEKMQYPQFRQKLLAIAANKAEHVEKIAQEIKRLGGRLPGVPPLPSSDKNSWQYLLEALNEQQRSSAERLAQAQSIRDELPQIAELLMQIDQDGIQHRAAIRDMLMKSDPQSLSHWLA